MSSESVSYRPIHSDLQTAMDWCANNGASSLRVTSRNHLYLRSVARKNTEETCWLVKFFNAIARVFIEGFRCNRPSSTADRLIELTSQSLQKEIDIRMNRLSKQVNAMIKHSASSKEQPLDQVKRLKEVIEQETQQLDALVNSGEQLIQTMIDRRLSSNKERTDLTLNQTRQQRLRETIQPLLDNVSKINTELKSVVVNPLNIYVATHSIANKKVDRSELQQIFRDTVNAMNRSQQTSPVEGSEEDFPVDIHLQGLQTQCDYALPSTTKVLQDGMAHVGQLITNVYKGLEKLDPNHPMTGYFVTQTLDNLLLQLRFQMFSLNKHKNDAEDLIHTLFAEEASETKEQLIQQYQGALSYPLQQLQQLIIEPLQVYLAAVKQQNAPIDLPFLCNVLGILETTANTWRQIDPTIEISHSARIFSYVLVLCTQPNVNQDAFDAIRDARFWGDEIPSPEQQDDYVNSATGLYIQLSSYKSIPSNSLSLEEPPAEVLSIAPPDGDLPQENS